MITHTDQLRVEVYRVHSHGPYDVSVHRFPVQQVLWILAPPGLNNGQIFVIVVQRLRFHEARAVAMKLGHIDQEGRPIA
jgi:hypothetical protein